MGHKNKKNKQKKKQQQLLESATNNDNGKFHKKFDERLCEKPAVVLKEALPKEALNGQQKPIHRDQQKKQRGNDGQSAVHQSIKQQLDQQFQNGKSKDVQKKSTKHKASPLDSSIDSNSTEAWDNQTDSANANVATKINVFESIIKNGDKAEKPVTKRKRVLIDSDDSPSPTKQFASSTPHIHVQPKGKRVKFDISSLDEEEEDSIDDEELEDEEERYGDDLTKWAEYDQAELDMTDSEMEDEDEFGSFMAEDEELEDHFSDEEEEEGDDYSTASTINLSILGYTPKESANCLVLTKDDKEIIVGTSPFKVHNFSTGLDDHSVQVGLKALQWLVSPIDTQTFFSDIFQKRVLVVKRDTPVYFDGFFSTQAFQEMLTKNFLQYGLDLNVASYVDGVRETHNPMQGRVSASEIQSQLSQGRSVQCVHPQVFNDNVWYLCEVLQEVFCSFVGANNYLTPAKSAGFAPHWDDIDAFMVQVEGKKYWKVYAPESADDTLPLESSGNFSDADFAERQPVFEGWLEQGDTLYVPRGFVHQARTGPDSHSHHVTISVCRQHAYADFLELATDEFVQMLTNNSTKLRAALPPLLLDMGGQAKMNYSNSEALGEKLLPVSKVFVRKIATDFTSFVPQFVDLIARQFFKSALPPLLSPAELAMSSNGTGQEFKLIGGIVEKVGASTEVRLIRKHAQRLLFDSDVKAFIIHRMNNSRRYEERPESVFDFPVEWEDGFTTLSDAYPDWTKVAKLGLDSLEQNIQFAELLYNNGLLLRRKPTVMVDEDVEKGVKKVDKKQQQENSNAKQPAEAAKNPAENGQVDAGNEQQDKAKKGKKKHKNKKNKKAKECDDQ